MHPCSIAPRSAASADVRSRYAMTTVAAVPLGHAWTDRLAWGAFVARPGHHAVEQPVRSCQRSGPTAFIPSYPRSAAVYIFSAPLGMGSFARFGGRPAAVLGRRPRWAPFGPPLPFSASRHHRGQLVAARPALTAWHGVLCAEQPGRPAVQRLPDAPAAHRPRLPATAGHGVHRSDFDRKLPAISDHSRNS